MIKRQYLLRPSRGAPTPMMANFANEILGELTPRWLKLEPAALTVTLTATPPPRVTVVPFRREPIALVSVWEHLLEERTAEWGAEMLSLEPALSVSGYLVQEAVPVESERTWPEGRRTPGAGLLTLLKRKRGLDDEAFLRRWHQGHTPLSLTLHPLWRYERNTVERPILDGSPPLDGIVEEHFHTPKDLLNPVHLFGGPWAPSRSRALMAARMVPNMLRTATDIRGFLDLTSLENYLVEEYRLIG